MLEANQVLRGWSEVIMNSNFNLDIWYCTFFVFCISSTELQKDNLVDLRVHETRSCWRLPDARMIIDDEEAWSCDLCGNEFFRVIKRDSNFVWIWEETCDKGRSYWRVPDASSCDLCIWKQVKETFSDYLLFLLIDQFDECDQCHETFQFVLLR